MKLFLIFFTFLIPDVFSIFDKEFDRRQLWEDQERVVMNEPNWNKYHPTSANHNSLPNARADDIAPRWYKSSLIEHWNDHNHDHNHTHDHLQEHEHEHNQTHLHVEEHDHTHEHAHTHKHNHLHDQAHNHTHDQGHEHDHKHKHKHSEDHSHDHHEYYSKRRRLSGADAYDEGPSKYNNYKEHPNHQYESKHEISYKPYYQKLNKDKMQKTKFYPTERPAYQTDRRPENEKYPAYQPEYHYEKRPKEKDTYSHEEPKYNSPRQPSPSTNSIKDYHMKSVEEYIGDSGKEFEGAAEKIVEGYMGDYMDKYMNEWYIKYCEDTGKYCDQIKVVNTNKETSISNNDNNQHLYNPEPNQLYPSQNTYSKNQYKSNPKYSNKHKNSPQYNYEKPSASIHYEKYPSDINDMIEKDKYIHNSVNKQYKYSQSPPIVKEAQMPQHNNNRYVQRPRRNQTKQRKERKRRGRNQTRKRRPQPSVLNTENDPYMNFEQIEDMFSGTRFGPPAPYNKYNGYSAIEETDIDTIDRSYGAKY